MTEAEFEHCIEKICRSDKSGLKDIYTEYLPFIYRTVYGIVGNKENAEDITSDFFVKLWSLAPKYKKGEGHKGYLATVARNMAIDFIRKNRREVLVESVEYSAENVPAAKKSSMNDGSGTADTDMPQTDSPQASPSQTSALRMDTGQKQESLEDQVISDISLREALEKLHPDEKKIIDMKVLGEMTYKEISELLGIPIGTVTWRYQEGIKKLRRCGYE